MDRGTGCRKEGVTAISTLMLQTTGIFRWPALLLNNNQNMKTIDKDYPVFLCAGGGLGNQMFQYAFYKSLIYKGWTAYLDISLYNKPHKEHETYRLDYFDLKT
jgi:hypothetical protein